MQKKLLSKPFFTISYAELWDKVNYYGLQSLLVLYFTKYFGFSDTDAYTIYGICTALSFGFSVLGGFLADKILGFYYGAIIGSIFIFLADIILSVPKMQCAYLGLSLVVLGFSFLKPSTVSLIGLLHKEDSSDRTRLFSFFYLCLNVGSITGPILFGIGANIHKYWIGFLSGALGMLSVLGLLYFSKKTLNIIDDEFKNKNTNFAYVISLLFICPLASYLLFSHTQIFKWFLWTIFLISFWVIFTFLKKISKEEKISLFKLLVPVFASIIFFAVLLQMYSSLTLFIDRYVDKNIFGWQIPTAWFSSFEPILLLFAVPFLNLFWDALTKRNINIKSQFKIIGGLFIAGIAFLIFGTAANLNNSNHGIILLVLILGYAFLAISELCIIPVALSLVNLLAPKNYKGTIMGFFYFSLMLSGYLSGIIAKWAPSGTKATSEFSNFFLLIGCLLFVFSILLLLFNLIEKNTFLAKTVSLKP